MKRYIKSSLSVPTMTDADRAAVEDWLFRNFPDATLIDTIQPSWSTPGIRLVYRGQRIPRDGGWIDMDPANPDKSKRQIEKKLAAIDMLFSSDVRKYAYDVLEHLGWNRNQDQVVPVDELDCVKVTFQEDTEEDAYETMNEFCAAAKSLDIAVESAEVKKVPYYYHVGPYWPYKAVINVPQYHGEMMQ